jgi:phage terminase large subunit-like protein
MSDEAPDPRYLLKIARETLTSAERRKKYRMRDFLDEKYWNKKQMDFFAAGASGVHQRPFIGGNQTGKTTAAAAEFSWHADGLYPPWWPGLRIKASEFRMWAVAESLTSVRNNLQGMLFGVKEFGTGMVPLESIPKKPIMVPGGTGAIDTAFVTHHDEKGNPDGVILVGFHSYAQGRAALQSETIKFSWADEKCPEDIFTELLARGAACDGHIIFSFTPAGPEGALGITQRFLAEPSPDRKIIYLRSADATHISPERIEQLAAEYGDEAETRLEGVPRLGMGPIFPTELLPALTKNISEYEIPTHSKQIVGFDFGGFGGGHPAAAVHIAWDYQKGRAYVLDSFRMRHGNVKEHVARIHAMTRGLRMRVAWPHDGNRRESDGQSLANQYKNEGALMLDTHATNPGTKDFSIEPGLNEIRELMISGMLVINSCNTDLIDELRNIHRDEDGKIVKLNDDLTSALRYALMMKNHGQPRAAYSGIGFGTLPDAHQKAARDMDPRLRFARGSSNHPDGEFDLFTGRKRE